MKNFPEKIERKKQTLEGLKEYLETYEFYDLIRIGFFKNTIDYPSKSKFFKTCEHCGSKYRDEKEYIIFREAMDEYYKEKNRLYILFRDSLFVYFNLKNNKMSLKAFELAYSKGDGEMTDIYNTFYELTELL